MKNLFFLILLFSFSTAIAQVPNPPIFGKQIFKGQLTLETKKNNASLDSSLKTDVNGNIINVADRKVYAKPPITFDTTTQAGKLGIGIDTSGFSAAIFHGGPTTSLSPPVGYNPGVNITLGTLIDSFFYQPAPALATLSGGGSFELTSASSLSQTLNWTATRQASTKPITSIVVASVSQTFTQPSQGGTVGGTQNVSVPTNTTTTYSNTVTTTDGKVATASVTYAYFPKRYWFYSSTSTPTSADVVSDLGGGNELTTSKAKGTQFTVTISGTSKTVSYAYPSSYGTLSSIVVSGLESIGAFHLNIVSVTNASGFSQNFNIYTSNNTFNAGSFVFTSVL